MAQIWHMHVTKATIGSMKTEGTPRERIKMDNKKNSERPISLNFQIQIRHELILQGNVDPVFVLVEASIHLHAPLLVFY